MIIGHLASGYVFSKLLINKASRLNIAPSLILIAGMAGAIAPDLDMVYFYLVDNRQHHHHTYWTHFPTVWLSLLMVSLLWFGLAKHKNIPVLAIIFSAAGCMHMLLDSIVGDVWWFAPFIDQPYAMFTVTARYQPWWLNFILHWSFLLELSLWVWAFLLWRKRTKRAES